MAKIVIEDGAFVNADNFSENVVNINGKTINIDHGDVTVSDKNTRIISDPKTFVAEDGAKYIYELVLGYNYADSKLPDGAYICGCETENETLNVPADIGGVHVVSVNRLVRENDSIKNIIIPDRVKIVNEIAINCPNLESVTFPKSAKIDRRVIVKCDKLSETTVEALNKANSTAIASTSEYGVIYDQHNFSGTVTIIGYNPNKNMEGKGMGPSGGDVVIIDKEYNGYPVSHIANVAMDGAKDVTQLVISDDTIFINGGALKDFTSLDPTYMARILAEHPDAFGDNLVPMLEKNKGSIAKDNLYLMGMKKLQLGDPNLRDYETRRRWEKGVDCLVFSTALGSEQARGQLLSMARDPHPKVQEGIEFLNEMGVSLSEPKRGIIPGTPGKTTNSQVKIQDKVQTEMQTNKKHRFGRKK